MAKIYLLPQEIIQWRDTIKERALKAGLDFFDVVFEYVDSNSINELASLGGFPQRYPHWRFGMEYDRLAKSSTYGLSKIYEMVINTDPCYAYLLTSNSLLEQKLVMAHVYGHADFFKNNLYFAHTNKKMLDEMANHATRVRGHQERFGVDVVEEFMDACLSLENLIDYHSPGIKRKSSVVSAASDHGDVSKTEDTGRIKTKSYLDHFVNPKVGAEEQKRRDEAKAILDTKPEKFPLSPERDVLAFLLDHAPLKPWQRDCLAIIRDEAYYFAPQGQTKIMNEGWASYWHTKFMTGGILNDAEVVDYADVHSGTVAVQPGGLNPYKLGLELFRDIEERWNKGQFGKDWENCEDYVAKGKWDKQTGLGREKIFEVRKLYNDVTFVDEFMTEDFCRRHKLFTFAFNQRSERMEIETREFHKVKNKLLTQLTNFGQPMIEVVDGNFDNKGELLLRHVADGRDLRMDYAELTLKNLSKIWSRPVNIQTTVEKKSFLLTYNGKEFLKKELTEPLI